LEWNFWQNPQTSLGIITLINQIELKTYIKAVLFKEKSSFRILVFLKNIKCNGINKIGK
jgi:hypothetical protein